VAEGGKDEDRIVELIGSELLIVDGTTDTPIGLAGVKGGRYAGVHAGTKNIIIEAAHFHPTTTRKTARRLGIVIDASKRFENEPSRELIPYAQAEIVKLIGDIASGTFEGWVDEYKVTKHNPEVTFPLGRVNQLLGLELSTDEMVDILDRIGARVASTDVRAGTCVVVGPWERHDLTRAEDFIEEIGRIYGLHHITSVIPEKAPLKEVNKRQYYTEAIRQTLVARGFTEVITSSFMKKDEIQLQNALASDKSYIRSSLQKNINKVLDANYIHADLIGVRDIRVFEIGTVFSRTTDSVTEHISIGIGVRTKGDGYHQKDDGPVKDACAVVNELLGTPLQ
jgi:phenylalanyl-tRNA synthetase beta chain